MNGHIMYQGLAGESAAYFTTNGYKIDRFVNPPDEYMKITSISFPLTKEEEDRCANMLENYNNRFSEEIIYDIKEIEDPKSMIDI